MNDNFYYLMQMHNINQKRLMREAQEQHEAHELQQQPSVSLLEQLKTQVKHLTEAFDTQELTYHKEQG